MIVPTCRAAAQALSAGLAGLLVVGMLVVGLTEAMSRPAVAQAMLSIETGGTGKLTLCRDWILFQDCHSYHHVAVPARFAVGDRLDLTFGSNVKEISYVVVRVARHGERCTVFDEAADGPGPVDRLDVTPCRFEPPQSASAR